MEKLLFQNNAFGEALFEPMHSPEGELYSEVRETLWPLLQTLHVDAKQRKLIWPDGKRLDLDESVQISRSTIRISRLS